MSANDKFFSGEWIGEYYYGESYGDDAGIAITFELNIIVKDGVITGTFVDEETSHIFDEPGSVEGFIDGDFTSFVKRYPCWWEMHPDDPEKVIVMRDKPSHEIKYEGRYIDGMFTGEWEIVVKTENRGERDLEYFVEGIWNMHKKGQRLI